MVERGSEAGREIETWESLCEELKTVGHTVLGAAPDAALDRAEGLRYLARLTSTFLRLMTADPPPARQILMSQSLKVGLDNPDYGYYRASLDPAYHYVLRGVLGDANSLGIGTFSGGIGAPQGLIRDGYVDTGALEFQSEGRFELRISADEQPGNWLPMKSATNSLQVREVLLHRRRQTPARLELEKLGDRTVPPVLDPERFLGTLASTGGLLAGTVRQFLGWTEHFQSHKHEIHPIPPELIAFAQGDPNTSYNYSYWEIGEDEAFVIEFRPPQCDYWNLQIGNHWLESLDYFHHTTHVNQETAVFDASGIVRVVVARHDPGVANWLDTAGHLRGGLALRWVGVEDPPKPRCSVVPLASLGGI